MQTLKILLVEDNRMVRMAAERVLTRAGHSVRTAGDGEEALRMVQDGLPDVVLLDLLLPVLSGEEVLRRLKQNPATAHIPVIIMTALSRKNAPKLMEEGAEGFVEKEYIVNDIGKLLALLPKKRAVCASSSRSLTY
jgi:CheY-like chemotaxis protein